MDLRLEDKVILVTGGDGGYVHLLRPDLAVHDRNIRARRSDGHLPRARFLRTPPRWVGYEGSQDFAISLNPSPSGSFRTAQGVSKYMVARCTELYAGQCGRPS